MEKGIQIALRYLENKLTRLINRGVLIKLTQSQNNYSNLHFYCSTLVFNIYFFEFAKLLGGPGPPRPLPTLRHCVENSGNQSSLRRTVHKDLKPSPHLLSPFQSRFPHLKCSELASSHNRHDRNITAPIPPWQQYRILCDAFRPTQQKNTQSNRYKMPKFATSTELEYYIDIVSETNNNCGLYFS